MTCTLISFVGIREFNKLNVPTHDRRHQVKAKEVICQAAELVHELVSGMSNFHTYTEQVSNDILCLMKCYFSSVLLSIFNQLEM